MPRKDSIYKGELTSSATVKKKIDFQGIEIHLDRPKGLVQYGVDNKGNEWERKYKVDYGFIPKTLGGDGDGLDIFIGPNKKALEAYWAIQQKDDGSFDEYKVFLGFTSREAAIGCFRDHIPVKYLKGMVSMRVDMMKAMLGNAEPVGKFVKSAMQYVSFVDELNKMAGSDIEDKVKKTFKSTVDKAKDLKNKFSRPSLAERVKDEVKRTWGNIV